MPGPLAVTVLGEPLVLWRTEGGALTAAHDRCPHREAPLSHGRVIDDCLQCPYHGWTFRASGACVHISFEIREIGEIRELQVSALHSYRKAAGILDLTGDASEDLIRRQRNVPA